MSLHGEGAGENRPHPCKTARMPTGSHNNGRSATPPTRHCPYALFKVQWHLIKCSMADEPPPKRMPLIFYAVRPGVEPVRDWLRQLPEVERHAIGFDLMRAQWRWPVGMPLCRALGGGLWEVRTDLPTRRTARVLLCLHKGQLVALHGFIKKTRTTPDEDLALARKRKKELEQ